MSVRLPKSKAQMLRESQAALNWYRSIQGLPAVLDPSIKPKRARAAPQGTPDRPLEKQEQKAILQFLSLDRRVAFVGRFNQGGVYSDQGGKAHFYRFCTIAGFPDLHGLLYSGRPFYFECKRKGEVATEKQLNFLTMAKRAGAIAAVVYSVDDVKRELG